MRMGFNHRLCFQSPRTQSYWNMEPIQALQPGQETARVFRLRKKELANEFLSSMTLFDL